MEQTDYSRFLDLFEKLVKAHKKDLTAALTKSQPTPFDVYNYLWKSYELELSHFWQRAIPHQIISSFLEDKIKE